jgi:flagellar basal body P-ring formation protein FlgA
VIRPLFVALAIAATGVATAGAAGAAPAAPSRVLTSEQVAELARRWTVEQLQGEAEDTTVEVQAPPRELVLPPGEVTTRVSVQAGSPATGQMTVLVEAIVTDAHGHRAARSATVNLAVRAQQEVLVAVRDLSRGAIVGAADVRRERRPMERLPRGPLTDPGEAVGKEMQRGAASGEVLTASAVAPARAVRRGAVVTLLLEGPGFRIVARGIASEDGAVGQTIKVVNQVSRRELAGKVEDERTVRVPF